jgi:transposase
VIIWARNYSDELKRDAVHQIMVRCCPVLEVSRRLGVSKYPLYKWQKLFGEQTRHIQKFLEHAKNLARAYFYADPSEKRQLLELCFSNMSIFGKTVEIEPRNWLWPLLNCSSILVGAPDAGTSRSKQQLGKPEIYDVVDALTCFEAARVVSICEAVSIRNDGEPPTDFEVPPKSETC